MCRNLYLAFKDTPITTVRKDKRLHGKKNTIKTHCGYSKNFHDTDKWVSCPIQFSLITSALIRDVLLFYSLFSSVPITKQIKEPKYNAWQHYAGTKSLSQGDCLQSGAPLALPIGAVLSLVPCVPVSMDAEFYESETYLPSPSLQTDKPIACLVVIQRFNRQRSQLVPRDLLASRIHKVLGKWIYYF